MSHPLGRWSVLDIETSGLNPEEESIIDLGYLQFEGTKLIKTFDSLVKFPMSAGLNTNYSKFTEKLTGITIDTIAKDIKNLFKIPILSLQGLLIE